MTIDFHSHILPSMDDGAKDVNESLELLKILKNQGVSTVCLTPHYNISVTVDEWLEKRKKCLDALTEGIDGKEAPKLILGAEVMISRNICEKADLNKLKLGDTDYIMLEIPWKKYSPWMSEEIDSIIAKYKLIPIIAHIDRYGDLYKLDDFLEKFNFSDVVYQINVESLKSPFFRMKVKKLLKNGYRIVFGSDSHNTKERPPHFDFYKKYINDKDVYKVF